MSDWKTEYERRLRRVVGVTDDTLPVRVETSAYNGGATGCDTCGYGADTIEVTITVWAGHSYQEFSEMGELMRALEEVPDEG